MDLQLLGRIALIAYLVVLSLLCVYGLHRYILLLLFYRVRRRRVVAGREFDELPTVTVQLPMYNEQHVAIRVIEAACAIEYPADKLEIQVLDDSTDETVAIASEVVDRMRAAGHDVKYVHRTDRVGYKAGALEAGLKQATGEFIAVFDADFVPPKRILLDTIHHFTDERVAMVQTRWAHLNRADSLLTNAQAVLLDGHFMIEHTARNRSGRYMSFNGTAGIWRKSAIEDAGGWQHDTLTEDLDLSYRAQMRGWRFVFRPDLTSPAELPPEMNAFKAQQHRWTKGGAQTCLKLLPEVLASPVPWQVKVEAFFHLTSCWVYVLMVLLSLLIGPALYARMLYFPEQPTWQIWLEMLLFVIGFGSALLFYVASQRELSKSWYESLKFVPALLAVGMGIAFNNAIAALEGGFGKTGEFVRTPKFGEHRATGSDWRAYLSSLGSRKLWQVWAELGIGLYLTACLAGLFFFDDWLRRISATMPFLMIFIGGYFYVAYQTLVAQMASRRGAAA